MMEFTEDERRIVTRALTMLSATLVGACVVLFAWLILRTLAFCSAAVVPVVLGLFLSMFFKPYYVGLLRLVRSPALALLALLATVFVPVGLLLWYAGAVIIDQISNLLVQGPELIDHVVAWFRATFPGLRGLLLRFGVDFSSLSAMAAQYVAPALKAGSGALKGLGLVVSALVTLIFFAFFLMTKERRGGEIVAELSFLKEGTRAFLAEQIDAFFDILVSFFRRQTLICLLEGCFYGAGFALVGLPYGFLVGFSLGAMNLIPFFGSLVCLPLALPLAYFAHGGSLTRLVLVLSVWLLGQLLDGYLITPRIQGNKTGLGYAGVIFSFLFWGSVLGPLLGMLLAIPLSAFCVVLWRAVNSRYFRPVV